MVYDCTLRRLPSQPSMAVRCRVPPAGVAAAMIAGFKTVAEALSRSGAVPAGTTYARYVHFGADIVDLEVGFTVEECVPTEDPVQASALPAGDVAVTLHRGPYEQLPAAVAALEAWMEQKGRKAAGLHWECYLNGPPDVTDRNLYETEVFVPLA